MLKRFALATAIGMATILGTPATSQACLWDNDTLAQERQRFPSVLELMTGKFLRHSPEYYQWRVSDRLAKLAATEGRDALPLMDDIGVALDKLGQHDEAIAMGRKALAIDDKRYESHANLGTFLIHAGEYEAGVKHIWKAIEINPQAHFGRERWQAYLVEYIIQRKADGTLTGPGSPLGKAEFSHGLKSDLIDYLRKCVTEREQREFDPAEALKGVVGMMRFGKHNHPILLEAAAQLMIAQKQANRMDMDKDGRLLAARCLLLAARNTTSDSARAEYRKDAKAVLGLHEHMTVEIVEDALAVELKEGEVWYAELRANEIKWISAGNDVDAQYAARYYEEPRAEGVDHSAPSEAHGEKKEAQAWGSPQQQADSHPRGPRPDAPDAPRVRQLDKLTAAHQELARLLKELQQMKEEFQRKHPELGDAMEPQRRQRNNDARNGDDEPEPERNADDRDSRQQRERKEQEKRQHQSDRQGG